MRERKRLVNEVEVGTASLDRFRRLLGDAKWSELERSMGALKHAMRGRVLWNINSTARGGGVAEMLTSLISYSRGVGIDERWAVIEGSPEFFAVTKKAHSLLHGVEPPDGAVTDDDLDRFEEATAANADELAGMVKQGDVAIVHDPQPAGLIPGLVRRGVHVVWRCHIGVDEPNDAVRDAWRFLVPYVREAGACVFSRRSYVWDGLDDSRVAIIAPCIDPFATKNQDEVRQSAGAILAASKIVDDSGAPAIFTRHDGSEARVVTAADLMGHTLPPDARIVTQVSRWDRLKDPAGVLEGFARYIAPHTDASLVLAGPAATAVTDDPEQPEVLGDLMSRWRALPPAVSSRIVIAQLPMQDAEENAAIVNALQRRSDVVVQKSTAEGFGLTVAEAMWKSRPVVASRVGGIEDQIEDGKSGILVEDPADLAAFGEAVVGVLRDSEQARNLGEAARRRVIERFITPCHLIDQADVITKLLAA